MQKKYLKLFEILIILALTLDLLQDHGMLSATASLGLIHMWDVEGGLIPIDKYSLKFSKKKKKISKIILASSYLIY